MKKLLSILSVAVIIASVFAACSKSAEDESTTAAEETTAKVTVEYSLKDNEIVTDGAAIDNGVAAGLISTQYTKEELGIDAEDNTYSFMEHEVGLTYEGNNYIVVEAMVKTVIGQNEQGENQYRLDSVGTFLVAFDASQVLKKDGDTYTELENRYNDYLAYKETTTLAHPENTTAE